MVTGYAPIGADLATYSMWTTTPTDILIDAYTEAPALNRSEAAAGVALTTALIAVHRMVRNANNDQSGAYRQRLYQSLPQLDEALQLIGNR